VNYDASPTLRLQRLPLLGGIAVRWLPPRFPIEVRYGDVSRTLPEADGSVNLVYSSHVLEHLALSDMRHALREVFRVLKPGGTFRGVVPDLAAAIRAYLDSDSKQACCEFLESTRLGLKVRPRTIVGRFRALLAPSGHRWMWDEARLFAELDSAGVVTPRRATFGDSGVDLFAEVESKSRWRGALGFECVRPYPAFTK
jgi:SAM-dependent methyltransferase